MRLRSCGSGPGTNRLFLLLVIAAACGRDHRDNSGSLTISEPGRRLHVAWRLEVPESWGWDDPVVAETTTGMTLVADRQLGLVRVLSSTGMLRETLIRPGQGPLEVLPPFELSVHEDTLYLIPSGPGAREPTWVHLGDQTSGHLRVHARGDRKPSTVVACANGGCFVREGATWSTDLPLQRAGESKVDSTRYGWRHLRSDGNSDVVWFERVPNRRLVAVSWPDGPLPVAVVGHAFDLGTVVTVSGGRFWWFDNGTGELGSWERGDETPSSWTLPLSPRTINWELIEDTTRALLRDAADAFQRNQLVGSRERKGTAIRRLPFASALVPSLDGGVWLEEFVDGTPAVRRYFGVDSRGIIRDTVLLAERSRLLFVGDSLGYAVTLDENGSVRAFLALRMRANLEL